METAMNVTTDEMKSTQILTYVNILAIPVLILIGVIGNTTSFFVFVATHLKYKSSSVYLAALNIVDTGFLISLIPAWLGWLQVDVFHTRGWCQTTIYASYVFAFMSVWIVVCFTAERFVVVFFPLKRSTFCTTKHAVMVVALLFTSSLLLYSYTLWTTSVQQQHGLPLCMPKAEYHSALKALSAVDTVTTLVIPCMSICIMNGSICGRLIVYYTKHSSSRASHEHQQLSASASFELAAEPEVPEPKSKQAVRKSQTIVCTNAVSVQLQKQKSFQNQTTVTLLIISSIFILLNFPSHAFRVYIVANALSGEEFILSANMSTLQELCLLLYYGNFALNMFLYSLCSRSFRKALQKLYKRLKRQIRALFVACLKRRFWFSFAVARYPTATHYPHHHMAAGLYSIHQDSRKHVLY